MRHARAGFLLLSAEALLAAPKAVEPASRFVLRWETLGANRGRPRSAPWPKPTMLQLVKLVEE